jgi:WD40 repeat protein
MRRWSRGWRFALVLGAYLLAVGVVAPPPPKNIGLLELVMLVAVFGSLAAGGWYLAGRKRGVRRGVGFVLLTVLATLTAMMIWDTAHRIKYRYTQNLPTPSVPVETPAIRTIRASKGRVECVAFSPDGTLLASGSNDHTVKLWDVQTGEVKRPLAGHDFIVGAVAFSPDGQTLVSGAWDDTVKLWDVNSGRLKTTIKTSNGVFAVAVSPDGKLLATGGRSNEHPENNLELWEMPTGKPRGLLKGHTDAVFSLAFSADGSILASGSSDNTVKLWDPQTGTVKRTVTGQPSGGTVPRLAFSPHGTLLAIAGLDPNDDIQLFDMASGASRLIEGSFGYSLAFSPDGKTVAVGANGAGQIELLDVVSGTLKRKLKGPRGVVASLVFSPDGLTLASGSVQYKPGTDETEIEAGTINLWPLQ